MAVGSLFTSSEEKEDILVEENEPVTNDEPVNPTEVELELKNAKRHGQEERKFFCITSLGWPRQSVYKKIGS